VKWDKPRVEATQGDVVRVRTVVIVFRYRIYKNRSHSNIGWRRGVVVSAVRRMNEVNARRARLVSGWVAVFGRVYHLGM